MMVSFCDICDFAGPRQFDAAWCSTIIPFQIQYFLACLRSKTYFFFTITATLHYCDYDMTAKVQLGGTCRFKPWLPLRAPLTSKAPQFFPCPEVLTGWLYERPECLDYVHHQAWIVLKNSNSGDCGVTERWLLRARVVRVTCSLPWTPFRIGTVLTRLRRSPQFQNIKQTCSTKTWLSMTPMSHKTTQFANGASISDTRSFCVASHQDVFRNPALQYIWQLHFMKYHLPKALKADSHHATVSPLLVFHNCLGTTQCNSCFVRSWHFLLCHPQHWYTCSVTSNFACVGFSFCLDVYIYLLYGLYVYDAPNKMFRGILQSTIG